LVGISLVLVFRSAKCEFSTSEILESKDEAGDSYGGGPEIHWPALAVQFLLKDSVLLVAALWSVGDAWTRLGICRPA
jgi:hypothetical protein